jgi:hypothetical protein
VGFFRITEQLCNTPEERKRHYGALLKVNKNNDHDEIFDFIYGNLSILDTKTASLLSFNAIGLAVLTIFVTNATNPWIAWVYYAGMVLLMASCVLCSVVVRVHWSTTDDLTHPEEHIISLLSVRRTRTMQYRLAWILAIFTIVLLLANTAAQLIIAS